MKYIVGFICGMAFMGGVSYALAQELQEATSTAPALMTIDTKYEERLLVSLIREQKKTNDLLRQILRKI